MANRQPESPIPPELDTWLRHRRGDEKYKQNAIDLLRQMVGIDSTPKPSAAACAQADAQMFDLIEGYLAAQCPGIEMERLPIRPEIARHPFFTRPYYTSDQAEDPEELVRKVYQDRGNLFVRRPQPGRPVLAFNAHIDTVLPHIPPKGEGDLVFGRGSCDDKGACLTMMLALQLISEAASQFGVTPECELLLQFVPDEETGGNGSLSASLETVKGRFDAMVVIEATSLGSYPANRGVLWYQTRLDLARPEAAPPGRDVLLEAAAYVVGELGRCGDRIKAESDHPLFPHRPVQTCHGVLENYGQHPSRVNDYIPLKLTWSGDLAAEIRKHVDEAVRKYCAHYGDKTQPGVGEKVLDAHITWSQEGPNGALLEVHGLAGHMGSVDRLDGAITKAAWIIRKLVETRQQAGGAWTSLAVTLKERRNPASLVLEGGQGFVPTHTMDDVGRRMKEAVQSGVDAYGRLAGLPPEAIRQHTTFDKLHNAAYACRSDGPAMQAILEARRQVDLYHGEPIRGWDVSCDARIFAHAFPDAEVITFGPGELAQAHSNEEHIDINHVLLAAEILVRMALQFGR